MSCDTPISDISVSELDDESVEDDGQTSQNVLADNEDDAAVEISKSTTKQPSKSIPHCSKKRQADEEYKLIKHLSESMVERHKKRKYDEPISKNLLEAFGQYVSQALSELDNKVCHLAQHRISNIIFQAQTGLLAQEAQSTVVMQQQRNQFQPIPSFHIPSPSNYTTSSYNRMGLQQQNSSLQEESSTFNQPNMWPVSN